MNSIAATVLCPAVNPPPSLPSGWFPDPHGRYDYRWFNGTAWTADVSDEGRRLVDPAGAAPSPQFQQAANANGNGLATAAITCGLLALLFAWMPLLVVIGLVLGVLALVFGVRGHRRAATVGSGRGRALAGAIAGGAAVGLSIVGTILTVTFVRELQAFLSPGAVEAEVAACTVEPGAIVIDGVLTNRSSDSHGYTVYGVVRTPSGVDDLVTEIRELQPGETTEFEMRRSIVVDEETCDARLVVHGPTPYGVEIDRVDD
jgi:hypothetical protein